MYQLFLGIAKLANNFYVNQAIDINNMPRGLGLNHYKLKIGDMQNVNAPVRLMTLNPGHFHAALVQKNQFDRVDKTVHVYAPESPDLNRHMQLIEGFNKREDSPTEWQSKIYTGPDYLERMLKEQPGNVMVTAGNNRLKTSYILKSVENGINVLSDKPMAIDTDGWHMLVKALGEAKKNNVLLYDIMTERRELTSRLLRALMQEHELFGELVPGTPDKPAMYKESIHHLYKNVSGSPLRRPAWYFDVEQQGEGIVDVTVHLVDLSMWVAFPDQTIQHEKDIKLLNGTRWPTMVSREQFERITGESEFPDYLRGQLDDNGVLPLYCNGEIDYLLKGHHVKVNVKWDYEAPSGGGDSQLTRIRGTRANLLVRQGVEQNFVATVFVEPAEGSDAADIEPALKDVMTRLQQQFPGAGYEQSPDGWKLNIPEKYYLGHEAHFGLVAQSYIGYLDDKKLPEWEVPNMITKYYITTHALEMALKNK